MRGYVRRLLVVGLVAGALGACGSPVMKPVPAVQGVAGGKALVNFVRPRVFFGDGVSFSIWDGDRLVGVSSAGSRIQYLVEPGKHVFMANAENWSYVDAELAAGKEYFIKVNLFPGVLTGRVALGAADANSDPRVGEWSSYETLAPIPDKAAAHESAKRAAVLAKLQAFDNGEVDFERLAPGMGR